MPFVPAPGVVQMSTILTWNSERCENVFHYHTSATIDAALLHNMANQYVIWFGAHEADFSNTVQLSLIYLRDLTTQFGLTLDFAPTTSLDGSRTSPSLSNNCSIAIKRQSGLAGRKNRGRLYHIGLTQDLKDSNNTIIPSQAAGIANDYNSFMSDMLTDWGMQEVILHRKDGTFTPISNYTLTDFVIDSQRRRLPGHNRHH